MAHPGYAVVQVRVEMSLTQLCAMYWDALVNRFDDADMAKNVVSWSYNDFTNREFVKQLVRDWLTWYGKRSVECGPKNGYPSDEFEAALKAVVARAYQITY